MDEELLNENNFSEEEYYPNSSTHRQSRLIKKNRMLRRTALSLRPLRQKSYVDHSPPLFDTDSDAPLKRTTRRSRNLECSWLADSQMHKVGYPNLNAGYSEEDSRDAADVHPNVEINDRATRHSRRRLVKPAYYYEEFEDVPQMRRSRRPARRVVREVDHRDHRKTDSNTNGDESVSLRTRKAPKPPVKESITEDDDSKSSKEIVEIKEEKVVENGSETKILPVNTSCSDENQVNECPIDKKLKPSRVRIRQPMNQTSKVTESDSSDSEEDIGGRKYSLRNRPLKQAPKSMQSYVLRPQHERRERRRYTRRRSSSSSNSSSSSGDRCRKQQKNPHLKKEMMKTGAGGSDNIVPIKPETLDQSVRFNSIGGLDSHIQCLKEMILLPMMYPEVFRQFQVQPPRGVLFHGPPGTGKTLISRALANECSFGIRKVSFFMRKGADLLSKWIGESEKQLRLLFEQAAEMKPSIIFFDELDGLAPVRSARQDQVHASIVSTLLALMDGLTDRGEVIVIGATNRIDAIDPALRRPGRFDRELYFPLPSKSEREEILKVHIANWAYPPSVDMVKYLAENTVGYCGSDLRALCSEAVIQSFRRTYPQVYDSEHRLLLEPDKVKVEKVDFIRAKSMLVPASHRVASGLGKKLLPILEPLLSSVINKALERLEQSFPHGLNSSLSKIKLSSSLRPAQLLLTGHGPDHGQSNHVAPALLFRMEHIHSYLLDLASLYREPGRTPEETCIQIFTEARKNIPSIIYIPNIDGWWDMVSEPVKAIFLSQFRELDPNIPILFLATSEVVYDDLPQQMQEVFSTYRNEIQEILPPDEEARRIFFKYLLLDICLKSVKPTRDRPKTPPPLPRAPTPPPAPISEDQARKIYETEEHTLRELRIFLRDMCKKLANNKLFFMFTKPVDTKEVPDYTEIIKQPMDLETMMMKVDFHLYECAKDFLSDIDLICQNALEYNPAKSSVDKQIRHRACSLRDYAYTLIKTEMDSDFEDKCQDIKQHRKRRKACTSKYLPPYMITPDAGCNQMPLDLKVTDEPSTDTAERSRQRISPIRKRKIRFNWKHGYLGKKSKKPKLENNGNKSNSSDESKNDPDSSTMEIPLMQESDSPATVDVNTALSIDCDNVKVLSSSHTERMSHKIMNELLSPSQLLDNPFCPDDVDEALRENDNQSTTPINCSKEQLTAVLDQTVIITKDLPLTQLLDLYNQFGSIIKKYSKTYERELLPANLLEELIRFQESLKTKNLINND
ncbi:hypothetical protein ABEB36_003418 [Hypothenemus hampei]|uniref:Bromo domain-containing protein n=1 Tax=Hypothenemus hampei TaxID=57062 RepID=A0ABD1FBP9_HYPHA